MAQRHHLTRYLGIQLWGAHLGWQQDFIISQQHRASIDAAPIDALHKRTAHGWVTVRDLKAEHPVVALYKEAMYRRALSEHDWTYNFSSDHHVRRAGEADRAQLISQQRDIDPGAVIWNSLAPEGYRKDVAAYEFMDGDRRLWRVNYLGTELPNGFTQRQQARSYVAVLLNEYRPPIGNEALRFSPLLVAVVAGICDACKRFHDETELRHAIVCATDPDPLSIAAGLVLMAELDYLCRRYGGSALVFDALREQATMKAACL